MPQLVSQPVFANRCGCSSPSFRSICPVFSTFIHPFWSGCIFRARSVLRRFACLICSVPYSGTASQTSSTSSTLTMPLDFCECADSPSMLACCGKFLSPSWCSLIYFISRLSNDTACMVRHLPVHSASCKILSVRHSRSIFSASSSVVPTLIFIVHRATLRPVRPLPSSSVRLFCSSVYTRCKLISKVCFAATYTPHQVFPSWHYSSPSGICPAVLSFVYTCHTLICGAFAAAYTPHQVFPSQCYSSPSGICPAVPFFRLHPPYAYLRSVCCHLPAASGISTTALFVASRRPKVMPDFCLPSDFVLVIRH